MSPRRFMSMLFGSAAFVAFVAALIIFGLGGWQIVRTRAAMLAEAEKNTWTLARALAQHAGRTIETVDVNLRDAVGQAESGRAPQDLDAYLRSRTSLEQVFNLIVIDTTGRWIADTVPPHAPMSSADRGYFAWHRDHTDRGPHFDDLVVGKTSGRVTIPLSRRINKSDGSFGGLVVGTLNPDFFRSFYQTVQMGPHGAIALWRDDGRMLVQVPEEPKAAAPPLSFSGAAKGSEVSAGVSGLRSGHDDAGRIFALEHVDRYPLMVSVAVSTDDALADWRREALIEAGFVGTGGIMLIALGAVIERRRRQALVLARISLETDRRYRLLAENASDLIILKPSFAGARSYVSPSVQAVLGWTPDELAALPIDKYVHPDDIRRLAAEFGSLTSEQPRVTSLHRVRHKAGHWVWFEAIIRLTRDSEILIAARDVTARHEAEQALVASEARWSFALNSSGQGVWDTDLERGQTFYSAAWKALLGYAADELETTDTTWLDLMHPADHAAALEANLDHLEGRTDNFDKEFRMRHKDGRWVWIHDRGKVIRRDHDGRPLRMIGIHTDVTAQKTYEQQLRVAKDRAEANTAAKAEFVANMSHELRTPLTGILGVHDLLDLDPSLSEPQRRLVRIAGEAARSLLSIVNDVLDFSKIDAGHMAIENIAFDLDVLLASCCDLARESLKTRPIDLIVSSHPGVLGHVVGDPIRIRQVLMNLLTNAVKFTPQGQITIRTTFRTETGLLRIDVTDSGIGIPADRVASLFERFTQADTSMTRRYGGTGLGLAICKRLVDLMEGQIGVEAAEGGGSRFWFELPLARHEASATTLPPRSVERETSSWALLLAEDNTVNAAIIAAMLESRGHTITLVHDGAGAVEAAGGHPRFDLILMDLHMPVMDGLSATTAIRRDETRTGRRRTPIIGLTANAMVEDMERCLASGMDAHIAKPIEWAGLFATLERLLGPSDRRWSDATDVASLPDVLELM